MALIGYARTSTRDQRAGLEDQVRRLDEAGCERIFSEHASGARSDRPEFAKAMDFLRDGDVLILTKPDRLGRAVASICKTCAELSAMNVGLKFLDFPLIDTTSPFGTAIVQIFAAFGELERNLMLERQRPGIEKAKAEGKYTGRAFKLDEESEAAFYRAVRVDGQSVASAAKLFGISRSTAYTYLDALDAGHGTVSKRKWKPRTKPKKAAV